MAQAVQTARGLLHRLIPQHANQFTLEIIEQEYGKDVFEIESLGQHIVLRGSNAVSIASALHWYLKYACHCHISWSGYQLALPDQLPIVDTKIRQVTPYSIRYMYNFCTFNYSMTWWDWARWEREIDWMALHGINMPLAMTGQEAVWMNVGKRIGMTEEQMLDHLTGPAYLAWHHMGNVDGIAGPLPQSWIEGQRHLQQKIVQREREFGMTPVLSGFYGHVPAALTVLYSGANITELKPWFGMPGVFFLDPQDPLFQKIAGYYYEEQRNLYGTDHLYAMDLFHEGSSPNTTAAYLWSTAAAVCSAMIDNDPKAVWVMQSWSMTEAIVKALPDDRLLLLDLYAEEAPKWKKTEAFYGKPWVWCMLHNFGGRNGLFGKLKQLAQGPHDALNDPLSGRMMGIGFAPEAIEENPVMYDLLSEMVWRSEPPQIEAWLTAYAKRRYGQAHDQATTAWKLLLSSVYSDLNPMGSVESIVNARPKLSIDKVCNGSVVPFYNITILVEAWSALITSGASLAGSPNYEYDLIDVGREVLAQVARPFYLAMIRAFHASDLNQFEHHRSLLETLLVDLDELVGTNTHFLTGRWMEQAKAWGSNQEETNLFEFNARALISTWWPEPLAFDDYAHKQWSGMLTSYYLERWKQFTAKLAETIHAPKQFNEHAFEMSIRKWEMHWMYSSETFATEPRGDALAISKHMFDKYSPMVASYWRESIAK